MTNKLTNIFSFGINNSDKNSDKHSDKVDEDSNPPPKMDPFNIAPQLDAYDHRSLEKHLSKACSRASEVKELKKIQLKT